MPDNCTGQRASSRMRRTSATPSTTVRRISHTKTKSGYASRRVNGCVSREPGEAIISKEDFERVQQQIASGEGNKKNATTQIFAGLVRCCGLWMVNEVCDERQNKIRNRYFSCTCYSQYGTGNGLLKTTRLSEICCNFIGREG